VNRRNSWTKVSEIPDFFRRRLTIENCNCRFACHYVTCPHPPAVDAALHNPALLPQSTS
jgi:hypothetical protein